MLHDWDKLRIFHTVAQAGSFTHAAQDLGLSQSAISRQMSDLEAQLKVNLFHRHARGLVLTEQGEELQRTVRDVFIKVKAVETQMTESRAIPTGELRVTTTMALGGQWLAPLLTEFQQRYPHVQVTLLLDDRELDLNLREADIALRMLPTRTDHTLIRRHLMHISLRLYAHKAYLDRAGRPSSLKDLDGHALLAFPPDAPMPAPHINWFLEPEAPATQKRSPIFQVNSYQALLTACMNKMGIASLPSYLVKENPDLEIVLPELETPRIEVFFVYTEQLRNSVKLAAFRDFLLEKATKTHD